MEISASFWDRGWHGLQVSDSLFEMIGEVYSEFSRMGGEIVPFLFLGNVGRIGTDEVQIVGNTVQLFIPMCNIREVNKSRRQIYERDGSSFKKVF